MITKEFFLNFFLTFMLLITISVMLMAIEGGISGFFWLLLVKGIPFFVISILNSIILLIVDLLVTKKKSNPKFYTNFNFVIVLFIKSSDNYKKLRN